MTHTRRTSKIVTLRPVIQKAPQPFLATNLRTGAVHHERRVGNATTRTAGGQAKGRPHALVTVRPSGFVALFLSLLLVIYPFARAYADEVSATPFVPSQDVSALPTDTASLPPAAESTQDTMDVPAPAADDSAPAPLADVAEPPPSSSDITTPEEISPDALDVPGDVGDTSSPDENAESATTTTENAPPTTSDEEAAQPMPINDATTTEPSIESVSTGEEAIGSGGGGGSGAADTADIAMHAEAGTESAAEPTEEASTTQETVEEAASATSTEEFVPSATTTKAIAEPSVEERISQELAAREEAMRERIKNEVESEYAKGCVSLDAAGYYCLKFSEREKSGPEEKTTNATAVSSDVGASGNKEIFYQTEGGSTELTHNTWDDVFPSKDVTGTHIVWQGQKDGRWQIFYATLGSSTPSIEQVTLGDAGNFNPRVDGNVIVWQAWLDNNWEIVLAEKLPNGGHLAKGEMTPEQTTLGIDETWRVARITRNAEHDMFPSVAGGFVTWQRNEGGTWGVYVYDTKTAATAKLSNDGTKSERPRLTFVWDERADDGVTRLAAYDVANGDHIDLTREAKNISDKRAPYAPIVPEKHSDPAALPGPAATSTATSSLVKPDGDGGDGDGNTGDPSLAPLPDESGSTTGAVIDLAATSSETGV